MVFLAAGLIAPWINAARFGMPIQGAIEESLGRKVAFEEAYFSVFSGPGFSLRNVTISEDARYGIEPFAYVPTLDARLRLDKLLAGKLRFASLRLVDPTLSLVKSADGTWNVVQLVQRLTAPRHAPLNFFPSFEVANGRVNFKVGFRKATLYISESDLSIYPERSGKVYIQFSGSPARTDRAGMGFGHVRGSVDWFLNSSPVSPNRIEAEMNLDPSNLSELTTLVEGHDIGVHGTISARLRMAGPAGGLKVAGDLKLEDVHRWDLLPSSGEEWSVRYGGDLDLIHHRLDWRTAPAAGGQPTPVTMHVRVNDFLAHAGASIVAELHDAPLADLLPLATRMGVVLPNNADLRGAVNGAIGYSLGSGVAGGFVIGDAEAALPGAPTLRTERVKVMVAGDHVHFDPARVEAGGRDIQMSGNYFFSDQRADASLKTADFPLNGLKPLANSWFGGLAVFSGMSEGRLSGQLSYRQKAADALPGDEVPAAPWSGQFEVSDVSMHVPGLILPLREAQAHVTFNQNSFEVDHLTAKLGPRTVRASYRYNLLAKHTERAHIEFPVADLAELETALSPADRGESLWARLRMLRRTVPAWLNARNLEGDLEVGRLLADGQPLGSLASQFLWQGAHLQWTHVLLKLPQGQVSGHGTVNLASSTPEWHFSASATGYPWGGGSLNAAGEFASTGAGRDLLRNLQADGSFEGEGLTLAPSDTFENVAGRFRFTFAGGWPDLRLTDLQAMQEGDEWLGQGATQSDGTLLIDLAREGRQIHVVSSLTGEKSSGALQPDRQSPARGLSLQSGLHFF